MGSLDWQNTSSSVTENLNAKCGFCGSPLHAASREGHLDVARLLLDHGAEVFLSAYDGRHLRILRLLLEKGVNA